MNKRIRVGSIVGIKKSATLFFIKKGYNFDKCFGIITSLVRDNKGYYIAKVYIKGKSRIFFEEDLTVIV